jgi:hypothetical protein
VPRLVRRGVGDAGPLAITGKHRAQGTGPREPGEWSTLAQEHPAALAGWSAIPQIPGEPAADFGQQREPIAAPSLAPEAS